MAGAAVSGVTGIVGAIGSIGSMISGFIGNFQMKGMNATLDLIEKSARYAEIVLGAEGGFIYETLRWIKDLLDWNGAIASLLSYVPNALYDIQDILTQRLDRIGQGMDATALSTASCAAQSRDITIVLTLDGRMLTSLIVTEVAGQLRSQVVAA